MIARVAAASLVVGYAALLTELKHSVQLVVLGAFAVTELLALTGLTRLLLGLRVFSLSVVSGLGGGALAYALASRLAPPVTPGGHGVMPIFQALCGFVAALLCAPLPGLVLWTSDGDRERGRILGVWSRAATVASVAAIAFDRLPW